VVVCGNAYGINDSGQITGFGSNGTNLQAFIGTAAGITPIPVPAGWTNAYAYGINNSGQITGTLADSRLGLRAFIGTAAGITLIPLPAGWTYSEAQGINDSGQITGFGGGTTPRYPKLRHRRR
jgi:uncharacterized membrane protein